MCYTATLFIANFTLIVSLLNQDVGYCIAFFELYTRHEIFKIST
jgi:hypothetical protein